MDFVPILGGIFAVTGAVMIAAAGREFARKRAFVRGSALASGVVVALTEDRSRDEVSYFPQVTFHTPAGRQLTFQSGMGSRVDATRIGDVVAVRYRPERPHLAEIDAFMPIWGLTLLFGGLGVAFLFVGLGVLTGVLAG